MAQPVRSTRNQIIDTTCALLEAQGYHATGLNQIVRESGSPKGSLYYYFPDGKEALTAEAVQRTGHQLAEHVRQGLQAEPRASTAIRSVVRIIAQAMERSAFRTGGPLMTVALEMATSSERINLACRAAYQGLQDVFADKLIQSGLAHKRARQLAVLINAAIEGGIILSRTAHSGDPLRRVADELHRLLRCEEAP